MVLIVKIVLFFIFLKSKTFRSDNKIRYIYKIISLLRWITYNLIENIKKEKEIKNLKQTYIIYMYKYPTNSIKVCPYVIHY